MDEIKEILNHPGSLALLIALFIALSPFLWRLAKWYWTTTKNEVKKEVEATLIKEFKEDTDELRVFLKDTMQLNKDQMSFLERSIHVLEKSTALSEVNAEKNHADNLRIIALLDMHLEDYAHMKQNLSETKEKVEVHEIKISGLEKILKK
jgi:hypothetical protein